jgi:hypothetical protein
MAMSSSSPSFLIANSTWKIQRHFSEPEAWSVLKEWIHTLPLAGSPLSATLFIGSDKDSALKRLRLLCRIRQQRIRDFDRLFTMQELFRP